MTPNQSLQPTADRSGLGDDRGWIEPLGADTGSLRLVLDADGVREMGAERQTKRRWRDVRWIEETGHYLYLLDTSRGGFIIPRRSFEASVYEQLKNKISDMHTKKIKPGEPPAAPRFSSFA